MTTLLSKICCFLSFLLFFSIGWQTFYKLSPETYIKHKMKLFNAIQIVTALASAGIWLPLLYNATFTGAGVLFGLGVICSCIFFVWAVMAVAETMKD